MEWLHHRKVSSWDQWINKEKLAEAPKTTHVTLQFLPPIAHHTQ